MKNVFRGLFFVLCLTLAFALISCGECKEHAYGEWETIKTPTCTEKGSEVRRCAECDAEETRDVDMLEHTFGEDGEIIKDATCTEEGVRRFTCSDCGLTKDEAIPTYTAHEYDDGVVTLAPTCYDTGIKLHTCTICGATMEVTLDTLPVKYIITLTGFGTVKVAEDGKYELSDPERVGYKFVKWIDSAGNDFAKSGTVSASLTVTPVFELVDTTTVEELYERAAGGADVILITEDIVIDRTIFVSGQTVILTEGSVTLKRDKSFAGDMFVIGQRPDGSDPFLESGVASLTLGSDDGANVLLIDGNRDNTEVDVIGSLFFMVNGSNLTMYDGVTVANAFKVGNERAYLWSDTVGDSCTMGGAALFIVKGSFYMYGGVIENNSVNTENVGNENDGTNYISSFGGAIYNFGNVRMYGGTIRNNSAVRGGAIHSRQVLKLYGGLIEGNLATNKGGAICTSESPYSEMYFGEEGAESGTLIFKNNVATTQGGAIFSYHYCPLIMSDGVRFEGNRATNGVGGAITTAGQISAKNTEFIGNYAFEGGGAVYQYFAGEETLPHKLSFVGCLFEGNEAGRGGAILISALDELAKATGISIDGCTFRNNSAKIRMKDVLNAETEEMEQKPYYGSGGAIYATKKTSVNITNTAFTGNSAAVNAGAVYLATDTITVIDNSSFDNNYTKTFGGAIYTVSAKTLTVRFTEFKKNSTSATGRGGAIYTADTPVITGGCAFRENSASLGGAVYIATAGSYTDMTVINGSSELYTSFNNNVSGKGGAICVYGNVSIEGVQFTDNCATEHGGAIYVGTSGNVTLQDCAFTENTVTIAVDTAADVKRYGGAIYVANGALTVQSCEFALNGFTAEAGAEAIKTYGGAIAATGPATISVSSSAFKENSAKYGGAISAYSMDGRLITVSDSVLTKNSSDNCGGAMYINKATATLARNTYRENSSKSGGAVYVSQSEGISLNASAFTANTATLYGGAVYVGEEASMTDTSSVFEENTAVNGGAIYANALTVTDSETGEPVTHRAEVALTNTTFNKNKAQHETDARGGAIYLYGALLDANGASFTDNTATLYGGAVLGYTKSEINFENTTFTSNASGGNGGAVWTYYGSTTTICGIIAQGNTSGGSGGFMYTRGNLTVIAAEGRENVFGGEGVGNTALDGGVLYVAGPDTEGDYSTITITGASFIYNVSTQSGAAIYTTKSKVQINGSVFEANSSGKNGGAVEIMTSEATISDTSFTKNTAAVSGGAIYVTQCAEGKPATTLGCTFTENSAATNGGAVYVTTTGLYRDGEGGKENGSTFTSNTGTNGGAIHTYGKSELYGSSFKENSATHGGAAYVADNAFLGAIGVSFTSNTAAVQGGAIRVNYASVNITDSVFTSNSAIDSTQAETPNTSNQGGAIYVYYSSARIEGCEFKSNRAAYRGGAIYMTQTPDGSAVVTDNCTFTENTAAENGGAVYVTSSGVYNDTASSFTDNTAANGAAITTHGVTTLNGTVADANEIHVANGKLYVGGDVRIANLYLASGKRVTVVSALPATASITVTLADGKGVAATPDGVNVTDLSAYASAFKSSIGSPVFAASGNLSVGFVIFEQPGMLNGYTVITSGTPTYQWHYYADGVGEAIVGQTSATLTEATVAQSYVCVVTYNGETLTTDPVVYLEKQMHAICGADCGCEEAHENIEFISINSLAELQRAAAQGGNYYLYCDIELLETLTVSSNLVLCLNGKDLKYTGSESGSVIKVEEGATLTVTDCGTNERAGYVDPETSLFNEGVYIGEGTALAVTVRGGIISGGNATYGGAIHVLGTLYVYGGNMINNTAVHGGAIYVADGANANIEGTSFTSNTASVQGGAIRINSEATVRNCKFISNSAIDPTATETANENNQGGAIYLNGATALIESCEFTSNTAAYKGGAIYATSTPDGKEVVTLNCTFTANTAAHQGGAVYVTGSAIYRDGERDKNNGSSFKENSATASNGGAIMNYGIATLNGTTLEANTAADQGGAVYTAKQLNVYGGSFKKNTAGKYAGAISSSASTVSISGGTLFSENTAGSTAGAIYLTSASTADINGASFEKNSAVNYAGAIYVVSNSKLTVSSVTFSENTAKNGGALAVRNGGTFTAYASSFISNSATSNGGAIYVEADTSGATVILGDAEHTDNVTFTSNSATSSGGAMYVLANTANATVTGHSVVMNGNSANGGGAIYSQNKTNADSEVGVSISFTALTLTGNTATGNGGAIYAYNCSVYTIGTLTATNNSSAGSTGGGVMYISQKAQVTIDSVSASGNSATNGSGGFIYITVTGTKLTVNGGNVGENTASVAGSETLWSNSSGATVTFGEALTYPEGTVSGKSHDPLA